MKSRKKKMNKFMKMKHSRRAMRNKISIFRKNKRKKADSLIKNAKLSVTIYH